MLFAALTNSVCLSNASFFFLFKYFLCKGYELSGEIALKNNHYYYYYYYYIKKHLPEWVKNRNVCLVLFMLVSCKIMDNNVFPAKNV